MTQSLDAALAQFNPPLPLGLALSGGADSTALLVWCARKWPGQVVALHINHGLQAAATEFETHCHALCAALNVPLRVARVHAGHAVGQSPEDAARIARYQGLVQLASEPPQQCLASIAIAQHADDQVETLLLALSRGAGVAGLSAMPAQWTREGMVFFRPWLSVAGADIRQWLQDAGIAWVEDPTNASQRYTRNKIRAQLLPAIEAVFPQFRDTFARSALNAAKAQELLAELATQDLAQMGAQPAGDAPTGSLLPGNGHAIAPYLDGVPLSALQKLSTERRSNVLRHWLKSRYGVIPSSAQLAELAAQVASATTRGQKIRIKVGAGFAVRKGPVLIWMTA